MDQLIREILHIERDLISQLDVVLEQFNNEAAFIEIVIRADHFAFSLEDFLRKAVD